MPVTGLRGRQILDGDIVRADLNTTTSGSAVTRRIVAGTNITLSSTGVDTGTGDVTINASFAAITLQDIPEAWVKDSVKVATTANITLSGTQTIDGIAVVAGDRVLVKNQTTASQNGIYVVAAGAWTRSTDANTSSKISAANVAVDQGTTNGGTTWDTDYKSTDTLDTTAMSWFRVIDTGYGQALTKTDDTNVTLTLGGTPATALIQATSLTLGWTGQLAVSRGGTGASTLTGVVIGNGTGAMTAVAGTASQLLRRNAGNTAYEFFTGGNLTKTDDTNVTLTLGGTPTGSLINAVSLTLGWTGTLSVSRGGTGAATLTGVLIGNGTGAVTAVAGTASQLLRRNAGDTAYEFFTFTGVTGSGTSGTIPIWNGTTSLTNSIITYDNVNARLSITNAGETSLKITGDGQGYTQGNIIFQTGTNALNSPQARGLGTYYFNEGNDVIWYAGNPYTTGTDSFSILRLSSATFNGAAADPAVATSLFSIDVNKTLFTNQIQSTKANDANTSGGQILLNGATGNRIDFGAAGVNPPTFTTRSVGTKITFYPEVSTTSVDYAMGIESSTLWFSIPKADGTRYFRWYGGTTNLMTLSSDALYVYTPIIEQSKSQAGAGQTTAYITNTDSTAAVSRQTRIATQHLGSGFARSIIYAAAYTASTKNRGDLSILTEDGSQFIANFGTQISGGDFAFSLYSTASSENVRLNANGNSWIQGGNLALGNTSPTRQFSIYNATYAYQAFNSAGAGAINFTIGSDNTGFIVYDDTNGAYRLSIKSTGQLRLHNYTTTSSFTGTAVGVLAFDSSGNILTITTPSGSGGITGTGTTNYVPKFTGSTSVGDSQIFDNGTSVGIGTTTFAFTPKVAIVTNGTNALAIQTTDIVQGTTGTVLYIGTNATTGNTSGVIRALSAGGTAAANIILNPSGGNVSIGTTSSLDLLHLSSASGTALYLRFNQLTRTAWQIGQAASNDELRFINASTAATALSLTASRQLILPAYTTTTSFTGTAVGVLAFDSSGNILTIATPSGSSQWTTNVNDIYYNTGNVGIGVTAPLSPLHILRASGTPTTIRWEQTGQRTYAMGLLGSNTALAIQDVTGSQTRWQLLSTGQFIFSAYTAYNSFSNTDAQGILGFDTSGNIISLYPPIYRHSFVADPVTANNVPANVSFFASSNSYVTEMDLTGKKRARLIARVTTAATAGTILRVRYAATFSTTASSYLLMGSTEIEVAISSTGILNSGWINLVAGAKIGTCYIALQTIGGDGATDPVLGQIVFEAEE